MRIYLTFICLLIAFNSLYSQNYIRGEAILNNNEKISGYFSDNLTNQNNISYKITLDAKIQYLDAANTKNVFLDGIKAYISKFIYVKSDSICIFAKSIVSGKYSLYEGFKLTLEGNKEYIYIAEKDNRLYTIPQVINSNFFKQLYGDCALEGVSKLNRLKIFCAEVIIKANQCDNSEYKANIKTVPSGLQFGIKTGYNSWNGSKAVSTTSGLIKDIKAKGYFLGINGFFVYNNKFFIELGFNYRISRGKNTFVQVGYVNQPIDSLSNDVNLSNDHSDANMALGWIAKINQKNAILLKIGIISRIRGALAKTYTLPERTPFPNRNTFLLVDQSIKYGGEVAYRRIVAKQQLFDFSLGFYFVKTNSLISYKNMMTLGVNYVIDRSAKSKILK